MSGTQRIPIRAICGFLVIAAMALSIFAQAQSAKNSGSNGAKKKLIAAWKLVRIDTPAPDGKSMLIPEPKGMLIYTRDGHMSVPVFIDRCSAARHAELIPSIAFRERTHSGRMPGKTEIKSV